MLINNRDLLLEQQPAPWGDHVRVARSLLVGQANGILDRPAAGQANLGECHLVHERVAAKRLLATQPTQVVATWLPQHCVRVRGPPWPCCKPVAELVSQQPSSPAAWAGCRVTIATPQQPSDRCLPAPTACRARGQDSRAAHAPRASCPAPIVSAPGTQYVWPEHSFEVGVCAEDHTGQRGAAVSTLSFCHQRGPSR